MKKVGTQVELDLTKVLAMLDKAFMALTKQSKVWNDWLNVVKKALPTLAGVEAMLGKVTGQLNQLKFTEEGATEAGKEEMAIRRQQITVLRAVRDEYREQASAVEKASRAAEQAAKREVSAANAATRAQERHTKATGRGLKKMLLWGIGAASAYRLFMKLRRAVNEFTQEVIKGTPELERMEAASLKLRAGLAAAFGDEILGGVRSLTDVYTEAEEATRHYTIQAEANAAVVEAAGSGYQLLAFYIGTLIHPIEEVAKIMGLEVDYLEELAKAQEKYNTDAQEFINKTQEQADRSKELTDKMDELRKALEKYNKAVYQITERGLGDLLQAQRDYYDSIADLNLDRQRQAEDDAIEAARRLEDIHLDFARRLAAIEEKLRHRLRRLRKKLDNRRRRAAEILRDKLLSIERRYQDKLLDIERTYARSMYEAIATRDATAALQAMRKRKEDIVDAKRDRARARADAFRDYARRIRDIEESLREQERLARESYKDQLEELHRWLREQEEDHRISLRRQEEDAALSYARSLVDLKQAFEDRLAEIQRQTALERRNARIDYLLRESAYARHLARMAAIYQSYQTTATPTTPSFGVPPIGFAEGGMMVVNRPTLAMFGEGGRPELVIAQPLSPTSHAHNITGGVTHQINATIQQSIAGMEGRIAGAVHQALAAVIH